ncbi:MAG: peptidoglycan DD-metalloendopeptidase family protein [Candidatus Micrarchaeota archaeon]|nr:peptidoglycan DD-metalloendopeptidase family protein [Candidatus Micrarchaeota archaeon]
MPLLSSESNKEKDRNIQLYRRYISKKIDDAYKIEDVSDKQRRTTILTEIITSHKEKTWDMLTTYTMRNKETSETITVTKLEKLYLIIQEYYDKWIQKHSKGQQWLYSNLGLAELMLTQLKMIDDVGLLTDENKLLHLDYRLLYGMVFLESGGKLNFRSEADARGILQVTQIAYNDIKNEKDKIPKALYDFFRLEKNQLTLENISHPFVNLLLGALYLRKLYDHYKQTKGNIAISTFGYCCGLEIGIATQRLTGTQEAKKLNESDNLNIVDLIDSIRTSEIKDYLPYALSAGMIGNINRYLAELVRGAVEKHQLTLEQIANAFGISMEKLDSALNDKRPERGFIAKLAEFEKLTGIKLSETQREEMIKSMKYNYMALAIQIVHAEEFDKKVQNNPYIVHVMFERPKEYAKLMGFVKNLNDQNRDYEIKQFADRIRSLIRETGNSQQPTTIKKVNNEHLSQVPKKVSYMTLKPKKRENMNHTTDNKRETNDNRTEIRYSPDKILISRTYEYGNTFAKFKLDMTNPISPLRDRSDYISQDGKPNAKPFFGASRTGNRRHNGLDIYAPIGTNVRAAQEGIVVYVQKEDVYGKKTELDQKNPYLNSKYGTYFAAYGKFVVIKHRMKRPPGYYYTTYAHLDTVKVNPGQKVRQGEIIGTVGITGNAKNATRPVENAHVHFDLRIPRAVRDPKTKRYIVVPVYDRKNCIPVNPLEE